MEKSCERFVELLTPISDIKLLCCIFQLYECGVMHFTRKDLFLCELRKWAIRYSLQRLQEKGIVRVKGKFIRGKKLMRVRGKKLMRVYELNMQNEIVLKLLELFRVVVRGGGGGYERKQICESKI